MTHTNTRRGFTQKVVNNQVILNLIQDLQRLLLPFINDMRGRFQIKFGMTPLYNNRAFTLIELLVVVLIIGILAAVAVPQYQVAVAKSRYADMKLSADAITRAEEVYYLANGQYTQNFNDLDFDVGIQQNNATHERYMNWGYCTLSAASHSYVICYLRKGEERIMGYQRYFPHSEVVPNNRHCFALVSTDENSTYNKVCRQETGKNTGSSYESGKYYVYQ